VLSPTPFIGLCLAVFLIVTIGYAKSPKGLLRKTFGDCWRIIYYRLDAFHDAQSTVSKYWKQRHITSNI